MQSTDLFSSLHQKYRNSFRFKCIYFYLYVNTSLNYVIKLILFNFCLLFQTIFHVKGTEVLVFVWFQKTESLHITLL